MNEFFRGCCCCFWIAFKRKTNILLIFNEFIFGFSIRHSPKKNIYKINYFTLTHVTYISFFLFNISFENI